MNYQIEALANAHCECGENPYWDAARQRALWTDIPHGRLFEFSYQTRQWRKIYDDELVGGFTLQADGSLLLFRAHNIALLKPDGALQVLWADVARGSGRFNDVIADPQGCVFAGTLGTGSTLNGGLFRLERDGKIEQLFDGTGCANGMGFSPDLQTFYWTDSTARCVYQFDYDGDSGALSNRRLWQQFEEKDGIPDGMTVDAGGDIWHAFWGGSCVRRFSPAGELREEIRFPVSAVSSCTFGGPKLQTLFVTTAEGEEDSDGAEGTFYRVETNTRGRLEFCSRIG